MAPVSPARDLTGHQKGRVFRGLGIDLASEQRHIDLLALTGAFPGQQGGQDSGDHVLAGRVVSNGHPHRGQRTPVDAGGADQPAGRLAGQVGTLQGGVGTLGTEGGPGGVDHSWVPLSDHVVAQAPVVKRAGFEVGDHHIGRVDQVEKGFSPLGHPEVDGDAALPPVTGLVVGSTEVVRRERDPTGLVAESG